MCMVKIIEYDMVSSGAWDVLECGVEWTTSKARTQGLVHTNYIRTLFYVDWLDTLAAFILLFAFFC